MSEQNPIFTVTALYPSKGEFKDKDSGQVIQYDSLVVEYFGDFTEKQLQDGAIGHKHAEAKIKGANNLDLYKGVQLPAQAKFIYEWIFNGKQPRAVLKRLEFINVK